ncbi:hypothetical protein FHS14_006336 [Paenibacillus baekrokdamisoli]|nr:hypothetical protein [Paenibacillus baekrokdamisoli]
MVKVSKTRLWVLWGLGYNGMFAVTNEKLVLVRFRSLHVASGIWIRIGFLARASALIRAIAAFVLILVDAGPYRSGIDARKRW